MTFWRSHLLGDDAQRVSFLRQEVEDAPDLEGVVVGHERTFLQVLPVAQSPAHFVEVLTVEVIRHLGENGTTAGMSHGLR